MLKIDLYISPKTIKLENDRDLKNMDAEDILYWCFDARVCFIDKTTLDSLLLLPEVSLFQFIQGLTNTVAKVLDNDLSDEIIQDKEGLFFLIISHFENSLRIENKFSKDYFIINKNEFLKAFQEFFEFAINETKYNFPNLFFNKNFIELNQHWQSIRLRLNKLLRG